MYTIQPKMVSFVPRMVNQGWCLLNIRMVTPEVMSIDRRTMNLDMVSTKYRMVNLEMV